MRTSNKIFTALLLVVFSTPVILALNLKGKFSKKAYVVVNEPGGFTYGGERKGDLKPYKVVKITGPSLPKIPGGVENMPIFTCHLRYSENASYRYLDLSNGFKDSVTAYNNGDTLFIAYLSRREKNPPAETGDGSNYFLNLQITVNLPRWDNVQIDGATVVLDSLTKIPQSMNIMVVHGGQLKLGMEGSRTDSTAKGSGSVNTFMSCTVGDLAVHTRDAGVAMGPYFKADHLTLSIAGHSAIEIKEATIGKLDGSISDSTEVNASWNYLRRLALLTGK